MCILSGAQEKEEEEEEEEEEERNQQEEGGSRRRVNTVFPVLWDVCWLWMTGSLISPPALFHLSLPFSPSSSSSHHSVTTGCLASVHLNLWLSTFTTTATLFDWQAEKNLKTLRTDAKHGMDSEVFFICNLFVFICVDESLPLVINCDDWIIYCQ